MLKILLQLLNKYITKIIELEKEIKMSIASQIQLLITNLANAYSAIANKGGTVPQNPCLANLPTAVTSIPQSGGGGGAGEDSKGKYLVRVVDYDGNTLKEDHLNAGATFTLPTVPTHTGLTFQEWVSPVTINSNAITVPENDVLIGPTYVTTSGRHELIVEVSEKLGMEITLSLAPRYIEETEDTVDWGDGTVDRLLTHTYSTAGIYTIKVGTLQISDEYGKGIMGTGWDEESKEIQDFHLIELRTADVDTLDHYDYDTEETSYDTILNGHGILLCRRCSKVSLSANVVSFPNVRATNVKNLILPNKIKRLGGAQESPVIKNFVIGPNIKEIDGQGLQDTTVEYLSWMPTSLSRGENEEPLSLSIYMAKGLQRIVIPEGIEQFGNYSFDNCNGLHYVKFPSTASSFGNSAFGNVGRNAIVEFDFSAATQVPTIERDSFGWKEGWEEDSPIVLSPNVTFKVPQALYNSWIAAENWSQWTDYIVAV